MNKILFAALLMLAPLSFFAQCPTDSIGGGSSGTANNDTSVIGEIAARCLPCDADSCVAWKLPARHGDTVSMSICLFNPDSSTFGVQVATGCNFLLWDSCGILYPHTPVNDPFQVRFTFYTDAQIFVCGSMLDEVEIEVKEIPQLARILDDTLLDLRTCMLPVGIGEAVSSPAPSWWRVDMVTGERRREYPPLGPGIYFEAAGETFSGITRKIQVIE